MGDAVKSLLDDHDLLLSLARFADNLESEAAIRKRFNFDESTWQALGENDALCAKVEALKAQRIASGASARERAQAIYATVPLKLGEIINSPASSPRFVIEASKEIRTQAAVGPEAVPTDMIHIVINLRADSETYVKPRAVTNNPDDISSAPQGLIAIAAEKPDGGGNNENVPEGRGLIMDALLNSILPAMSHNDMRDGIIILMIIMCWQVNRLYQLDCRIKKLERNATANDTQPTKGVTK